LEKDAVDQLPVVRGDGYRKDEGAGRGMLYRQPERLAITVTTTNGLDVCRATAGIDNRKGNLIRNYLIAK
jgi:hypothetical protein